VTASFGGVERDFSGSRILWFPQDPRFDAGSFATGGPAVASKAAWLARGLWLQSKRGENAVVAASWQKSIPNGPQDRVAGSLSLQLKQNRDWKNLIKPGDGLACFMSSLRGDGKQVETFLGLAFVDSVDEGRAPDQQSGAMIEVASISAQDIGKVLDETSVVYDPAFAISENNFYTEKFISRMGQSFGLSPPEMILTLVDIFFNAAATRDDNISEFIRGQWRFPGAEDVPIASLIDFERFVQVPLYGYNVPNSLPFSDAGNVWSMLSAYSNACVNEMFVDVRDLDQAAAASMKYQEDLAANFVDPTDVQDQRAVRSEVARHFRDLRRGFAAADAAPSTYTTIVTPPEETAIALVFRQRPYDTGSFFALPCSTIDESEIVQSNFSRSMQGARNFFRFSSTPVIPPYLQEALFGIVVNKESIARFGLRRQEIESIYVLGDSKGAFEYDRGKQGNVGFEAAFQFYVDLVATWNAFNERMLGGSALLHFRPDIRIGTRVAIRRRKPSGRVEVLNFYVQNVRHSFVYLPGQSSTALTLTRGFDKEAGGPESATYWTADRMDLKIKNPFERRVDSGFVEASAGRLP
jgi:hypothetical protein